MRMNAIETIMMNNPLRAAIQRRFEARRLLEMGGVLGGGRALEVGCGRGIGVELILDRFGADRVDAFDLDPRMVERARRRLARRGDRVRLWVGDASCIAAPDASYDAVFDFGIVHHVPDWRRVLGEIRRVLKPGGRLYAEEVFKRFIEGTVWSRLLEHPRTDRFDHDRFRDALTEAGFRVAATRELWSSFGWFVASCDDAEAARGPVATAAPRS